MNVPVRRWVAGIPALAIALAIALGVVPAADAAPDPAISLEPILNSQTPGVGNFDEVTDVVSPPGEPERLLVVQRPGLIDEVANGVTSTFLDLEPIVAFAADFTGFEKGLWSLAFPADYQTSHSFWAVFTVKRQNGETGEPDIELAEFKTEANGAVVAGSERVVARIPHPTIHHYGGQITFGPEGDLYWSIGDGSVSVEASQFRAPQDLESPLGKILRIDPRQNGAEPFQIPPGNPFASSTNPYTKMIWAYGLRNPWRFSIDRASGTLAIGDVGNVEHEEVDLVSPEDGYRAGRGDNFGWPCREGAHEANYPVDGTDGCPLTGPYVDPVFDYPHTAIEGSSHNACAIMGGVIAGEGAPAAIDGRYLYADHCTGQIRSLDPDAADPASTDRLEIELPTEGASHELSGEPNTFGTDSCGRIYVGTNIGFVYRLKGAGEAACPRTEAPFEAEDPMAPEGPQTIRVTKAGTGSGTVTSTPAAIDCGATCEHAFPLDARVRLAAASASGSKAATWSGCDAVNRSDECEVVMSAAKDVTATFDVEPTTTTSPPGGDTTTPPVDTNSPGSSNPPGGSSSTPPTTSTPPPPIATTPEADAVRLSIVGRSAHGLRLRARLTPCEGNAPRTVVLRAAGSVVARHTLTESCTTTFVVRPRRAAQTFKATVEASDYWSGAVSTPLRIPARR